MLGVIEAGLQGIADPEQWETPEGRAALTDYFARIGTWVSTPPAGGLVDLTPEEIARFYHLSQLSNHAWRWAVMWPRACLLRCFDQARAQTLLTQRSLDPFARRNGSTTGH